MRSTVLLFVLLALAHPTAASPPGPIDPEVGPNDFRISQQLPDGNPTWDAWTPSVAHNPLANEYLVVWRENVLVPGEPADTRYELFGQRLDADGNEIGTNDFQITGLGADPGFAAFAGYPDVVFNPTAGEYLVVWSTRVPGASVFEVYGQRLDGKGLQVGADDFLISTHYGVDTIDDAVRPSLALNPIANEYLVVWSGEEPGALNNEFEIYGQRLDASGSPIGASEFRISDMGPDGNLVLSARWPDVVFNPTAEEYLVVWSGDDVTNGDLDIFGQRLSATGVEMGANDFLLSDVAGFADFPSVAYNGRANEYLVVFDVDKGIGREVYGQRVDASGNEVGADDFRISDMGADGDDHFVGYSALVVYTPRADEYLVAWRGDDDTGSLVDDEYEVYAQRLDAVGNEIGPNDARLTDLGADGDATYDVGATGLAYNGVSHEYFLVFSGDDDAPELVEDEYEVYGQRLAAPADVLHFSQDGNANGLYRIDPHTGTATLVGAGVSNVTGATVGLAPSGASDQRFGSLPTGVETVDDDGSGTAAFSAATASGLAYDPDTDTIFAYDSGSFFPIDGTTGVSGAPLAAPPAATPGLAFLGERVYGLASGGALYAYHVPSNVWSLVGDTGVAFVDPGLAVDGTKTGWLYAIGSQDANLYAIDRSDATSAIVGPTGIAGTTGGGLALPEPGSLGSLAAGVACLLMLSGRRRAQTSRR